jgi:hypothetical protein
LANQQFLWDKQLSVFNAQNDNLILNQAMEQQFAQWKWNTISSNLVNSFSALTSIWGGRGQQTPAQQPSATRPTRSGTGAGGAGAAAGSVFFSTGG